MAGGLRYDSCAWRHVSFHDITVLVSAYDRIQLYWGSMCITWGGDMLMRTRLGSVRVQSGISSLPVPVGNRSSSENAVSALRVKSLIFCELRW